MTCDHSVPSKDCYADHDQWDQIHEMLKDAFLAVPASGHRRLWALRMLALSHQGKNVTVAMGKMKDGRDGKYA